MRKCDELSNPDSCMSKATANEMTFVLLGRDESAPLAILDWIVRRVASGKNNLNDPKILDAWACARIMEAERTAPQVAEAEQSVPKVVETEQSSRHQLGRQSGAIFLSDMEVALISKLNEFEGDANCIVTRELEYCFANKRERDDCRAKLVRLKIIRDEDW